MTLPYLIPSFAATVYVASVLTILMHELAHVAMATCFGLPCSHITVGIGPTLYRGRRLVWKCLPLGGSAHFADALRVPLYQLCFVSSAGPLTNLLLASASIALLALNRPHGLGWSAVVIAWFNLSLFFDNVMMEEKTDGGVFWHSVTRLMAKRELSPHSRSTFNRYVLTVQIVTSGAFLGWMLSSSSALNG